MCVLQLVFTDNDNDDCQWITVEGFYLNFFFFWLNGVRRSTDIKGCHVTSSQEGCVGVWAGKSLSFGERVLFLFLFELDAHGLAQRGTGPLLGFLFHFLYKQS